MLERYTGNSVPPPLSVNLVTGIPTPWIVRLYDCTGHCYTEGCSLGTMDVIDVHRVKIEESVRNRPAKLTASHTSL